MMKISSDEKKRIIEALSEPYGSAQFMIDGYNVDAHVLPRKPLNYAIYVSVEKHDCKFTRQLDSYLAKFWRVKRGIISSTVLGEKYTLDFQWLTPDFRSAQAMIRHFEKHNESIKLIRTGCIAQYKIGYDE